MIKSSYWLLEKKSAFFMLAGGKLEKTETAVVALQRELQEELDLQIEGAQITYLGCYQSLAANEKNCLVSAELFQLFWNQPVAAQAELAEVRWLSWQQLMTVNLAPLLKNKVLPLLMSDLIH